MEAVFIVHDLLSGGYWDGNYRRMKGIVFAEEFDCYEHALDVVEEIINDYPEKTILQIDKIYKWKED